ncbi:hypothetical protein E2C01_028446 [Portunus trituberculatus]|uniref:Uncharacterized protein n=1 Tax=Portunus trituberculatus TaxID=210409 RepID=A0A5B7EP60_PORTR|nr:hypothetical protein [Portunus trituberculatus]
MKILVCAAHEMRGSTFWLRWIASAVLVRQAYLVLPNWHLPRPSSHPQGQKVTPAQLLTMP